MYFSFSFFNWSKCHIGNKSPYIFLQKLPQHKNQYMLTELCIIWKAEYVEYFELPAQYLIFPLSLKQQNHTQIPATAKPEVTSREQKQKQNKAPGMKET